MKIPKSLLALAAIFSLNSAPANVLSLDERWPQIKAYHSVMLKTLQNNGVCPESVKSHSEALYKKAVDLSVESMPEEFRNPKIIQKMLSLKMQTEMVHSLVREAAGNTEIKSAAAQMHEAFSEIIELCSSQN